MTVTEPARPASTRTWMGLVVLLLPALLVAMDISILFVASPAIAGELAPTTSQWLWMMDAYSFVMAGLLITMGSVGDRLGRRRLLMIGAAVFGIASAGLSLAPSPGWFIAARVLLGVGAATLAPSTLALIRSMFTDGQRRSAVGAWTAAFSGGAVAGPLVGGLLLEHFWWGSVFLVNVPVMVVLLVAGPLLVPESRQVRAGGFDLPGAIGALLSVVALVFAGKRFAEVGADPLSVVGAVGGLLMLVAVIGWWRRAAHPLVDLALFRRPAFSAAVGAYAMVAVVMAGLGLLAFTFLQTVHGMSALTAAITALPTFLGSVAGAALASALSDRVRADVLVTAGSAVGVVGLVTIGTSTAGSVTRFIGGYILLTLCVGLVGTLANSLVLESAPAGRAGSAASVSETGMTLGEAVGIALFGTVSAAVYAGRVGPETDVPAARETVAGAFDAAAELPAAEGDALRDAASAAFMSGLTTVSLVAAALLAVTGVVAGAVLRRHAR